MSNLMDLIAHAEASEIDELLKAVLQRYSILFPQWEIFAVSLRRNADRNAQLDEIIFHLNSMKTLPEEQ